MAITAGAFYVAFAQGTVGTYGAIGCTTLSTATFFQQGTAYVTYFVPGVTNNIVAYYGNIYSGTSVVTTLFTGPYTAMSPTSSCVAYPLLSSGTFTAVILASTTSPLGTSTDASATFTVVPVYVVAVYADSACSTSQTNSFTQGATAYVQFEVPAPAGGEEFVAKIVNASTSHPVFSYTGQSSTSTCYAYSATSTGTYTGVIAYTVNTSPAQSGTSAFSEFTVGSMGVPDLAHGFVPLLVVVSLLFLGLRRRRNGPERPPVY